VNFFRINQDPHLDTHPLPDAWREIFLTAQTPDQVVPRIWAPIANKARGFVVRLETITIELRIARSADGSPHGLLYVTQDIPSLQGWVGGLPANEDNFQSKESELGVPLPDSYRKFTGLHDGFFRLVTQNSGFLPLHLLQLDEAHGQSSELHSAEIHRPASGGRLRFYLGNNGDIGFFDLSQQIGTSDYQTILLSPASRPVSGPKSYWGFLKDFTIRDFIP
jgi:SMI1 / KNR4 family (SUKH-1)